MPASQTLVRVSPPLPIFHTSAMDDSSDFIRDAKIVAALPQGCEVISVEPHGETNWSVGHRVDVQVEGQTRQFFLKILDREDAAEMALGEYESQVALSTYLPDNVCPALGQGTLESDPTRAFFMTEYHELRPSLVGEELLAEIMHKLHSTSVSPNGKFGFPVATFKGYTPIDNSWCDTWEEYFARMFRNDIAWEQSVRGEDPEFNQVAEEFFQKVVPRLLRPLQTGGRSIQPVLIHGDLWDGNVEFDMETNKPIIFDACCCYGHNEFELSTMNTSRYKMNRRHINEYIKRMEPSEPKQDFDDRLAIYTMRHDIVVAGLWPNWIHLRGVVKEQMRELLAKYPNGIDGFSDGINAHL